MIAVASIYVDRKILDENLVKSLKGDEETFFIQGSRNTNIASVFNNVLKDVRSRFVIFSHPDVQFSEDVLKNVEEYLSNEEIGAVGLVGMAKDKKYVFSNSISEMKEVSTLDACFLAVDRTKGMFFDESNFDELHLYVEDFCLYAGLMGLKSIVIPAKHFYHLSDTFHKCGPEWGNYRKYRDILSKKWKWRYGEEIYTT
jgi:hypothetical protein